jgi:hypothetical protein
LGYEPGSHASATQSNQNLGSILANVKAEAIGKLNRWACKRETMQGKWTAEALGNGQTQQYYTPLNLRKLNLK